jgi:hypothetical protein
MRLLLLLVAVWAAFADSQSIQGRLVQTPGQAPALEISPSKRVALGGDPDTVGVLNDKRLANARLELRGRMEQDRFVVDPIHTKAMHVHREGKKLLITYWCDLCAIRTYTPGICWCCQQETELDLREDHP